jgi:hypothetical protein
MGRNGKRSAVNARARRGGKVGSACRYRPFGVLKMNSECACLPSLLFRGQGRTFQCWECLVGFGSFGCSVPLLGNQHHRRIANESRLTRGWHDVGILDEMFMQALPQPPYPAPVLRAPTVCVGSPRQARRSESLLSCAWPRCLSCMRPRECFTRVVGHVVASQRGA